VRARILVLVAIAVVAFAAYRLQPHAPGPPPPAAATETGFELPRPEGEITFALDRYPVPPSPWRQREQATWCEFMADAHADVIVVPFETTAVGGTDQSTRSLMAATLASELANNTHLSVLDPYLAGRCLGDPMRRFETSDIVSFAQRMRARHVIRGFIGADFQNHVTITVTLDAAPFDPTQRIGTTFTYLTYTPTTTPLDLFRNHLREILDTFAISDRTPPTVETRDNTTKSATDPFALTAQFEGGPAEAALRYQVLGVLTPGSSERVHDRMFEHSLLAVEQLPSSAPEYRALKARALFNLHRRPEALAVLANASATPETEELVAALNGNLPDVEAATAKLTGAQRLFGLLDANHLRVEYGAWERERAKATAASFAQPDDAIAHLILMQFLERDFWRDTDNTSIVQALERSFPVAGPDSTDMTRAAAILGQPQQLPELAVDNHWQRFAKQNAPSFCCTPPSSFTPTPLDYLEVLRAHGEANVIRVLDRMIDAQGLPQRALDFADSIAPVYAGDDAFEVRRARALAALAANSDGAVRDGQTKTAVAAAYQALFWEQGQTWVTVEGRRVMFEHGPDVQRGMNPDLFRNDVPPRQFINTSLVDDLSEFDSRVRRLSYATSEFDAAEKVIAAFDAAGRPIDFLLDDLTSRFRGNPKKDLLLGERNFNAGRIAEARKSYEAAVATQPESWDAYLHLGYLMIGDGEYENAARLFRGFRGDIAKGAPLEVTNNAFYAGNLFYWRGRLDDATPFLEISASTQTGAQTEIQSATRLALMRGDYMAAALGSRHVASRYQSTYAFRDYLSLLHLLGHSSEAWEGFAALVRQYPTSPHVWESASVGQRIEKKTDHDIVAWVQLPDYRTQAAEAYRMATIHLVRSATMDRIPSPEMIDAIKSLDGSVVAKADGVMVRPMLDDSMSALIVGPAGQKRLAVSMAPEVLGPTTPVSSELALFVEGYRNLKLGDTAQASRAWAQAATTFNLAQDPQSFLQPYYAFAMAASGQSDVAKKTLDAYGPPTLQAAFDHKLAEAVLLAFAGSHDAADRMLTAALANRVFTEARPVHVEYEFAEILDWLSTATNVPRYRARALEWAKVNQKISPWFAWPYALEAKSTDSAHDRQRAMQRVAFLDSQSVWLHGLAGADAAIAAARTGSNPFATANATNGSL